MQSVAPNVQLAAVAAFLATLIEWAFSSYGHPLPPTVADGLPGFLAVVVAHGYDVLTGENKARPVDIAQGVKANGNGP